MNRRVEKLRGRIEHYALDAFLITSLTNLRYLFGFTGSHAIGLITSDLSFLITDRRYRQQAFEEVKNAKVVIAKNDLLSELRDKSLLEGEIKLGFEAIHLSIKHYSQLKKILPQAQLIASERIVEKITCVKEEDEVECIRKAAAICAAVFDEILHVIKPGVAELDLSAEISYRSRKRGSQKDPFEPIVASGLRSALPHGISTSKKMELSDLLVIDFGAVVDGYAADITRTVSIGKTSPEQREMIDAVMQAIELAETGTKPGLLGKELDKIARDHLENSGFKKYFQHSLGHGLGLEVHELPRIGETSEDVLQVGNVITLEPGVYLPGLGGVRIEDDFVITEIGVENLSSMPREVVSVG